MKLSSVNKSSIYVTVDKNFLQYVDEKCKKHPTVYLEKSKARAARRRVAMLKAIRKEKIAKKRYGIEYYKHLHQYSKNKIHCSCNLCKFRPVWNPDNKPMQDYRRLAGMQVDLDTYKYAV